MSDVRLVTATIDLVYDEVSANADKFELEFNEISETDEDSIGQWIKHAKVRTETNDSDALMLNLLVELYRKIDKIELILTKGAPKRLPLAGAAVIESIGLEHFKLNLDSFEPGKHYYGRVEIATFPKREIAFFFEAVDASLAKIVKMHVRDEKEWGYYMTACERAMIRQMKGL
ncbi:MAG: hypothetical protein PHI47_02430 [Sulfuricurvum sp.]|uniref:hypothetical protein n=1 Tax=Sulfuricurvum sp. TaxID=2025608 RepID=UPI00261324E4|nr:hypothetical protein [Sulfuricurvum sp.]MDD5158883.1 hypothetical protein [Sulfuricurvum sp.]